MASLLVKVNVSLENQSEKLQRCEILFDEILNYNILGLLENIVYTDTKKKPQNILLKVISILIRYIKEFSKQSNKNTVKAKTQTFAIVKMQAKINSWVKNNPPFTSDIPLQYL